jgi:NitT/TauT family transport system ATP-binding protein
MSTAAVLAPGATAHAAVALDGVTKVHGRGPAAVLALDDLRLDVAPGEFVCLVGPSGCGKSTLLSLVAGLDRPTAGRIAVIGDRPPALMFQGRPCFQSPSPATSLSLRLRGMGRARQRASCWPPYTWRSSPGADPTSVRRHATAVALARTLGLDSPVLLMDEPFGALDAMTRDLLHDELERLWQRRGLTVLFVTYNVREAARLGDRIVLLSAARVGSSETTVAVPRPRRIDSPQVARWPPGHRAASARR